MPITKSVVFPHFGAGKNTTFAYAVARECGEKQAEKNAWLVIGNAKVECSQDRIVIFPQCALEVKHSRVHEMYGRMCIEEGEEET